MTHPFLFRPSSRLFLFQPGENLFPGDEQKKMLFDTVDICDKWEGGEQLEEGQLRKGGREILQGMGEYRNVPLSVGILYFYRVCYWSSYNTPSLIHL